ncbi:MAG: carbohydrate ABC transporter permease [Clostridiales bacterium]|nr:carbohydrate ABC transporter permease [Clostridiales bacterium]
MKNVVFYRRAKKVLHYILVLFISSIFLLPLFWMIRSAFMSPSEIFVVPPIWIPKTFQFKNFSKALTTVPFYQYFLNTMKIVLLNVFGAVISSSLCAYSFARLRWKGRDLFFGLLMSGMMLPGAVTLIPTFLAWRGIVPPNSYIPLIAPAWFGGGAFNIFLLRQFMRGIPPSLDEAALVDGASYLRIFVQIILPLAKSALIVVALFQFMGVWNDFLGPLVYVNREKYFTLALGLQMFIGYYTAQWELLMAAATIILVPPMILFLIGQRYFIQGIAISGMKG